VTVRAWRDTTGDDSAGFLRLTVVDTGIGAGSFTLPSAEGVGLANIESRLSHLFGASAAMTLRETPGGGTTVELCIPWMVSDAPILAER
jgi:signal transduction histidine kinase